MLLVIVGAGASYDSDPQYPPPRPSAKPRDDYSGHPGLEEYRPPIANDLFGTQFKHLYPNFKRLLGVFDQLRSREPDKTVEDVLNEFAKQAKTNETRAWQLLAIRYYIQRAIGTCDPVWYAGQNSRPLNLSTLIDQIDMAREKKQPALFVTFNYDRLIEHALESMGHRIESMNDYIKPNRHSLIKIHGSMNWSQQINNLRDLNNIQGEDPITSEFMVMYRILEQWKDENVGEEIFFHSGIPSITQLPAIAIPTSDKDGFVCPDKHVQFLKRKLPEVTGILTLGWAAREKDFIELLKDHLPKRPIFTQVVTGGGDREAGETLLRFAKIERVSVGSQSCGEGFSNFMRRRKHHWILQQAYGSN